MSGVKIRQRAALKGQRGSRNGKEVWPAPQYRAALIIRSASNGVAVSGQGEAKGHNSVRVKD